MLASILRI